MHAMNWRALLIVAVGGGVVSVIVGRFDVPWWASLVAALVWGSASSYVWPILKEPSA